MNLADILDRAVAVAYDEGQLSTDEAQFATAAVAVIRSWSGVPEPPRHG